MVKSRLGRDDADSSCSLVSRFKCPSVMSASKRMSVPCDAQSFCGHVARGHDIFLSGTDPPCLEIMSFSRGRAERVRLNGTIMVIYETVEWRLGPGVFRRGTLLNMAEREYRNHHEALISKENSRGNGNCKLMAGVF